MFYCLFLLPCRSLEGSSIRDSDDGELTVGGISTGEEYEGAMQDVRIYTDSLSERYSPQ